MKPNTYHLIKLVDMLYKFYWINVIFKKKPLMNTQYNMHLTEGGGGWWSENLFPQFSPSYY